MTNIQAINLLKGLEQSLDDYCDLNDEGKTAFRMAITALELFGNSEPLPSAQPEPHWIPCSERYPDMDERVLVYTGAHEYHVWDCMSNRADNYFWEDEEGLYRNKYEASLWMPLPEPYREEEEDGTLD